MDSASLASSLLLNGLTLTATFTPLICKGCDHRGEHHHHHHHGDHHHRDHYDQRGEYHHHCHGDRHHHHDEEGESVQDDDDGERDCL